MRNYQLGGTVDRYVLGFSSPCREVVVLLRSRQGRPFVISAVNTIWDCVWIVRDRSLALGYFFGTFLASRAVLASCCELRWRICESFAGRRVSLLAHKRTCCVLTLYQLPEHLHLILKMQWEPTALFQARDGAAEGIQADYHQAVV